MIYHHASITNIYHCDLARYSGSEFSCTSFEFLLIFNHAVLRRCQSFGWSQHLDLWSYADEMMLYSTVPSERS